MVCLAGSAVMLFDVVVEPLTVVIHAELHLRPDLEDYAKPRIEVNCISTDVSIVLRSCQVAHYPSACE